MVDKCCLDRLECGDSVRDGSAVVQGVGSADRSTHNTAEEISDAFALPKPLVASTQPFDTIVLTIQNVPQCDWPSSHLLRKSFLHDGWPERRRRVRAVGAHDGTGGDADGHEIVHYHRHPLHAHVNLINMAS